LSLLDNAVSSKAWTTILIDSGKEKGAARWHLGYTKPLLLDNFSALDYLLKFPIGSAIFQWTGTQWVQPRALYKQL
jgi:hypothetical protein